MIYANREFGTYARRRHKEFKSFLVIQDPLKPVPLRKTHQNWKVQPLLKHAIMLSNVEIVMGKGLDIDEDTIGCIGRHLDILQITYKKEGGDFQCDVMCCVQMATRSDFTSATIRLQSASLIN